MPIYSLGVGCCTVHSRAVALYGEGVLLTDGFECVVPVWTAGSSGVIAEFACLHWYDIYIRVIVAGVAFLSGCGGCERSRQVSPTDSTDSIPFREAAISHGCAVVQVDRAKGFVRCS